MRCLSCACVHKLMTVHYAWCHLLGAYSGGRAEALGRQPAGQPAPPPARGGRCPLLIHVPSAATMRAQHKSVCASLSPSPPSLSSRSPGRSAHCPAGGGGAAATCQPRAGRCGRSDIDPPVPTRRVGSAHKVGSVRFHQASLTSQSQLGDAARCSHVAARQPGGLRPAAAAARSLEPQPVAALPTSAAAAAAGAPPDRSGRAQGADGAGAAGGGGAA